MIDSTEVITLDEERLEISSTVKVHIIGEVLNPGVYDIPIDSRVEDAIKIAGGFTENADKSINMAKKLKDGGQVIVKKINVKNVDTPLEELIVNINTADADTLSQLPGIGEVTANNIIKYREQNGNFQNVEDIQNVPRIGSKLFEQIKDYITVK